MLFTKALSSPSIAAAINVTVTMPMTMPSVVNTERSLFARMALHEIARPSRNSVKKFMESGVCFFVAGDQTVKDADDALRMARDGFLVRDDDDGVAFFCKFIEQR